MKKPVRYVSLLPLYGIILCGFILVAFWGSRTITVISEKAPLLDRKCVIIDAGHGGEDGGATSCTGVLESRINLDVALKLNDLMHLLGIETMMIRTTDSSVSTQGNSIAARKVSDLKERVRIVNEADNAILVSIHQNHFSDSRYSGAQVFYAETYGSEALAKELQSQLIKAVNQSSNRQIKRADGVYLMQNISCTGVLVECGFLSNPEEEAQLRNDDYQKDLCCILASVFSRYLHSNSQIA